MFCDYKDMFGKPGEGVHSYRFMNIAVIDVLLVIIISVFLGSWKVLGGLTVLGIIAHRLFCVRTTVDRVLFD